jgi:TonB family protein
LCLLACDLSPAQTPKTAKAVLYKEYFDANWRHTDSLEKAKFYRIGHQDNEGKWHGLVRDFYMTDTLQMRGHYVNGKRNGVFVYHYPNGAIKAESTYENDAMLGKHTSWYTNGRLREESVYEASAAPFPFNVKLVSYWDSTGVQTLKDGNGKIAEYHPNGKLYFEETYRDNNLQQGVSYDKEGNRYTYDSSSEQMPEFPGGIPALMDYLSKTIRYPYEARRKGAQGKVFVSFVVAPDGSVTNVHVPQPAIGYGCEEEAVRVVQKMPLWKPGKQRGQPVPVRYALPINFKM